MKAARARDRVISAGIAGCTIPKPEDRKRISIRIRVDFRASNSSGRIE